MKKLSVQFRGWGQDWLLGTLAQRQGAIFFEYSQEALRRGVEFSPLRVKLVPGVQQGFPECMDKLPGFIADALPDGWGRLLMDRAFERAGRDRNAVSALERLAYIGDGAMGALSFEPAIDDPLENADLQLIEIAQAAHDVMEGRDTEVLGALLVVGGSPQGARPKALVQFDAARRKASTDRAATGEPWLVKFPARGERKEVCALEQAYAMLASACGIDIPPSALFEISREHAAFGVQRFDRVNGVRVPVLSAAGALHADFRVPQVGYLQLLQVTGLVTRDRREVLKLFQRCIFNVVFNNRDDHVKNFAFRMNADMQWMLSPAFDLTYSSGPRGEHQTDVMGNGRDPGIQDLLVLAKAADIPDADARASIESVCDRVAWLAVFTKDCGVPAAMAHTVLKVVNMNAARFTRS